MAYLELIAEAFEALSAHIAVLDECGMIRVVNGAWREFARVNGCSDPDAYLHTSYLDACARAVHGGDRIAKDALRGIEAVLSGDVERFTQRYPCPAIDRERWYMMTVTPLDSAGGAVVAHEDVTALVTAEQHQRQLARELNHRVKNTLAIVQAISSQTARVSSDSVEFTNSFSGRLVALARAHDLLTEAAWTGARLDEVVRTSISPFITERLSALSTDGPVVALAPGAAVALSLAFHELATNATKHGALSCDGGNIDVAWRFIESTMAAEEAEQASVAEADEDDYSSSVRLEITWTETSGSPINHAQRRGYGTRMLQATARQLDGIVAFDYRDRGVTCRFDLSAETATARS